MPGPRITNRPSAYFHRTRRPTRNQQVIRAFDKTVREGVRDDSGQVVHTQVLRRRQSSLLHGVAKPDVVTFTSRWGRRRMVVVAIAVDSPEGSTGPRSESGARFTKYLTIYRKIIARLSSDRLTIVT